MLNAKKHIESKINDIDQMLKDLDIDESMIDTDTQNTNPAINIDELDVVDVLHNILN